MTNDPAAKNVRLKVLARVEMELAITPARIVFKEFIGKNGSSEPLYARLTGSKSSTANIVPAESGNPLLKVEVNKDGFDGDPDRQIRFSVLPGMEVGRFRERIVFKTDIEGTPTLKLYVMGEVVGNITVSPKNISLGRINPEQKTEKTLTVRAADDSFTFNIIDVSTTIQGLETKVATVTPGKEYQVAVSLAAGTEQPVVRGKITIKTDSAEQEEMHVRVFGFTQAPPGLDRPASRGRTGKTMPAGKRRTTEESPPM